MKKMVSMRASGRQAGRAFYFKPEKEVLYFLLKKLEFSRAKVYSFLRGRAIFFPSPTEDQEEVHQILNIVKPL